MREKTITLKKNHQIIKQGDSLKNLFIIKSGSIKEVIINEDGSNFITNFHFKNDILGLNAIDLEYHPTSFFTLEETVIEKISLFEISSNKRTFDDIFKKMANSLNENTKWKMTLAQSPEEKISSLLLEIFNKNTINHDNFNIPMTREDIANHLGLSKFTVSRIISKMKKNQIKSIDIHK